MCDRDSKVEKWICEYCTYENYPSSIKCTMCKGAKPMVNEDIFRLSPPQTIFDNDEENGAVAEVAQTSTSYSQSNPPSQIALKGNNDPLEEKWECKICTYLNWPRSLRCVQCCTRRGETLDIIDCSISKNTYATSSSIGNVITYPIAQTSEEARKNHENTEKTAESIRNNDEVNSQIIRPIIQNSNESTNPVVNVVETNKYGSADSLSCSKNSYGAAAASDRSSPFEQQQSPADTTNPTQTSNLANTSQSLQTCYTTKWACNTCTYENWPKSLKCSMCGEPKDSKINSTNVFNDSTTLATINSKSSSDKEEHLDTISTNNQNNKRHIYQLGSTETINNCDNVQERQERRVRHIRRQVDWQWLNACLGVVENNYGAVEAYISCGGNPGRALTGPEIAILNRNSGFEIGHTLIHLAIQYHREEMLPMLFAQISGSGPGIKRVPSYVAPDLASDIRRHFANTLRMRKSVFKCQFVQEHATFALPAEIEELPVPIQEQLYDELLDRDAQKQLENTPPALNWSLEITARLGSRLLVLWNRSAGDCLLDSAMQATWGVFDRDNVLRRALADSLHQCCHIFYPRWKEYEMFQASILHFTLEEAQWEEDWATLLSLASQPGASLEQLHIFVLAHILRRPIIVYGVKYVKSFRGEDIGYARFEGLYLPIFWDHSFCIKSPIALGYTRGHFSALVPTEPLARIDSRRDEADDVTFLPLMDCEMKLLPIHFISQTEFGREETIMRQWLDVCVTDGGILVAQQKIRKRPLLVAQMLEEWLNHYRRIAQIITAPFVGRTQIAGYSSDGDSDEE